MNRKNAIKFKSLIDQSPKQLVQNNESLDLTLKLSGEKINMNSIQCLIKHKYTHFVYIP